jgi:hypothetical protein
VWKAKKKTNKITEVSLGSHKDCTIRYERHANNDNTTWQTTGQRIAFQIIYSCLVNDFSFRLNVISGILRTKLTLVLSSRLIYIQVYRHINVRPPADHNIFDKNYLSVVYFERNHLNNKNWSNLNNSLQRNSSRTIEY